MVLPERTERPAAKESFAAFLSKKYGKLPYPPEIPEPALWNARSEGIFLDPVKNQRGGQFLPFFKNRRMSRKINLDLQ